MEQRLDFLSYFNVSRFFKRLAHCFILVSLCGCIAGSARGQNLVVNGGFGGGVATGWSWIGGSSYIGVLQSGQSYIDLFGSAMYQDLPTTPGQMYSVRFDFMPSGEGLTVWWGDEILFDYGFAGGYSWTTCRYAVLATNPVTRLKVFGGGGAPVDNFIVQLLPASQPNVVLTNVSVMMGGQPGTFRLRFSAVPVPGQGQSVSLVDFIEYGTTVMATAFNPPYTADSGDLPAGTYAVCARVTDAAGVTGWSPVQNIVVDYSTASGPPVIVTQPADRVVNTGTTANFSVFAGGQGLSYQWRFNGADLPGATNALLAVANVGFSNAGNYSVWITNSFGTALSSSAHLGVLQAPSCTPAPSGLVALWEAEGNTLDSLGTNDGIAVGNLAYRPGEMGAAFHLNGVDAGVRIPASPSLDVGRGAGFSIEGWINPGALDTMRPIVDWNDGGWNTGVRFWISQSSGLYCSIGDTSGGRDSLTSPSSLLVSNVFKHVAFTYSAASKTGKLYCDGVPVASRVLNVGVPQTGYNLCLGVSLNNNTRFMGDLHGISLYSRALSDAEILGICQASSAGKCGIAPSFLRQPLGQSLLASAQARFSVRCIGTSLAYRWQKDGVDLLDGGKVSGASTPTLVLNGVVPADSGIYRARVSNATAQVFSSNAPLAVVYGAGVVAWGDNSYGQTNVPAGLFDVLAVVSGGDSLHGLALRSDHTVTAWGDNSHGQCAVPDGLTDAVGVAAGAWHSLALRADGEVVGWGNNDLGQITIPVGLNDVQAIAAGAFHNLAVRTNGTVVAWGDDSSGQTDVPAGLDQIVAVAGGYNHSLALKRDGTVVAWGNNDYAQTNVPPGLSDVIAIAAGDSHNLALKSDGTVVTWGYEATDTLAVPGGLSQVIAVAGGYSHSVALRRDGTMVAWGWNAEGETSVPPGLAQVGGIAAGQYHTLALLEQGAPVILYQPWNIAANPGEPVPIRVDATGSSPLAYQWRKNGIDLENGGSVSGATSAVLTINAAGPYDVAGYSVRITNAAGAIVSGTIQLNLLPAVPPAITRQPASTTNFPGANVSLTIASSGAWPLFYQWMKDGQNLQDGGNIQGASTPSLHVLNVQQSDEGFYTVSVSNALGGLISAPARLEVLDPPTITIPPHGVTNVVGGTAVFSVTATGFGSLTYAWQRNGTNLTDGGNVMGSRTAVLSLSAIQMSDKANYSVAISNSVGYTTSTPVPLNVVRAASITSQPSSRTNYLGTPASFSVMVQGEPPFNYQWQRDGSDLADNSVISGSHGPVLTLSQVSLQDAGAYHVNVTSPYGSALSSNAILSVIAGSFVVAWGDDTDDQTNVPPGLLDVVAIASGPDSLHSLLLRSNHDVVAWGMNDHGQTAVPAGLTNVSAVAAGMWHSLALKADGIVVAWGDDSFGQSEVPAGLKDAAWVAAGAMHSLAIRSNGTVVAWGDNSAGQSEVPAELTNVVAVSAGYAHSLALKSDGTVMAWGDNSYGQLNIPPGASNVIAISAGDSHNLVVTADGRVLAWGYNEDGEANVPAGLSNVVAVAAGNSHSLVLRSDGTVAAWGWNGEGQSSVPTGFSSIARISAGAWHSLALVSEGLPMIIREPANQTVVPGDTASLTVSAVGALPVGYQWQKDGTNLIESARISGTATPTITLGQVQISDRGDYQVIITNVFGGIISSPARISFVAGTPPHCEPDAISTAPNTPVSLPASDLSANDSDPWGLPLSVVGAGPSSSGGGTIELSSGVLTYTPALGFVGSDSFTYTVSDASGVTGTGTVTAVVGSPSSLVLTMTFGPVVTNGDFVIRLSGVSGVSYSVEAAANPAGPWTKVLNVTVPAGDQGFGNAVLEFRDPVGTNEERFYRTVYPSY
ncbi:MAG: immunoglobulin domain-containing protein [Verrucomicrobiota bacterium]